MDLFGSENQEDLFAVFNPEKENKKRKVSDSKEEGSKKSRISQSNVRDSQAIGETLDGEETSIPSLKAKYNRPLVEIVPSNPHFSENHVITEKETRNEGTDSEIIFCEHDICLPPDGNTKWDVQSMINPPYPTNPAKTWPFTLDPFQKKSIAILEREESVLVSAHTSAGKTVVAEYAISKSLKAKQRVVYTSPIKALSNQKYRELYEAYQDVGLMTGDITINPNASCLVMTTEILRSMLYRGSEIMREVAWVIFDEIHYMRDKERGVVWEETIILLPDKVRYVFLSATIPNAKEFASWIAKIHQQPCHVVYTDVRPTPLQHYIFPAGSDGLHLVVDEKSNFKEEGFQAALAALGQNITPSDKKTKGKKNMSDIYKILKMIMERNYQPVIIFSFSKKECEANAMQMAKLDLNTDEERKLVQKVFENAIDSLSDDDKNLPQVKNILPLLRRGIGIHHSGLLPILKEVIEILFQEGLIKALFATETFSIGLNMPAKTVVFTNVRKFDGSEFRWISSGEYIQMSGRAGRRGLDERGIVIMMVDEKMEPVVAKNMVKGSADPLISSFHIGYNMLLNLLRVEDIKPEEMLRRSFHQYQNERALPEVENRLRILENKKKNHLIAGEESVAEYHELRQQMNKIQDSIDEIITQPINILPYLQPGRLVKVKDREKKQDWGWGVVVNFQKKNEKGPQAISVDNLSARYIVDVLLLCSSGSGVPKPCPPNENGVMQIVPVLLPVIKKISSLRIYIPKDLRSLESRMSVAKSLKEIHKRFKDGIPLLDPIEDMKIEDTEFKKNIRKLEMLEDKLHSNEAFKSAELQQRYENFLRKLEIEEEIKLLKKKVKESDDVILKQDLKAMKRVLRRLGYINSDDIIELKGRVACEINASDELVLTELIFAGVFNEMEVEKVVAVLSCFTFEEKHDSALKLKEELDVPYRKIIEVAKRIARISIESKLSLNMEEYIQSFSPYLIEVVYAWCKGAKFSEICEMTEVFEGTIIRCMRRLEELLRQLSVAAKSIGNSELENKFAEGINKLKRDIVFAASLYL